MYGLKQAPRAWYDKLAQYFIFYEFTITDSDSSLFVKMESKGHLMVLLYVDDMLITRGNEAEISRLRNDMLITTCWHLNLFNNYKTKNCLFC